MSVQLELYPQNYQGYSNPVSSSSSTSSTVIGGNMFSDGETFTTLNSSSTQENTTQVTTTPGIFNNEARTLSKEQVYAQNDAAPLVPGAWHRWRTTQEPVCNPSYINPASTNPYPTQTGGNLIFEGACYFEQGSLIMQRLSGLTIGQTYTLTITIPTYTRASNFSNGQSPYFVACQFTDTQAAGGQFPNPYNSVAFVDSSPTQGGGVGSSSFGGPNPWVLPHPTVNNVELTFPFTAHSTQDVISLMCIVGASVYNPHVTPHVTPDTVTVSSIRVNSTTTTTTTTTTYGAMTNGSVICDLYEDEDIPLTLSIDDFKNVAEKVQSYSKAFSLPATKRNNQIFDNIFEITRTANGVIGFNPYVKTQCILREDGFVLFEGYLRLINVQDKEGEVSYDVNLYSEAVALADVLKVKDFVLLDFTELEHDYTITNIKASWTGALTYTNAATSSFRDGDTVKYPFVDWSHNFQYDSSFFPVLPNLEAAFRPFINIKYIIEKIFADTPFTFTSSFFDSADFEKLFMDFNWGDAPIPQVFDNTGSLFLNSDFALTASFQTVDFGQIGGFTSTLLPASFGYSSGVFTATAAAQTYTVNFNMTFKTNLISSGTFQCEWVLKDAGGADIQIFNPYTTPSATILYDYSGSFTTPPMAIGETLEMRAKELTGSWEIDGNIPSLFSVTPPLVTLTTGAANTSDATLLQALRGELNQWEFLKGIMTMFNLVTIPDKSNLSNILIEPYTDVFINNTNGLSLAARSIAHDWTDKIDVSEIKLSPLTDLKRETIFKFVEDDDDYAFNLYKNSVPSSISGELGHLYGSLKYTAHAFTILEGQEEIIAEPFAATVIKPLMEQFADFITPSIYSYDSSDGTSEGFDNSPRIMYNNGVKDLTSCTYAIPAQNQDSGIAAEDQFLQFSHLTAIPTVTTTPIPLTTDTKDFNFGACQLIGPTPVADNLFSRYWQPYFGELYNADTRTMSIKVNLNAGDINTFNMYDTVFIKNRQFRVNKIDYKPNDLATVEFILIP